MPWRSLIDHWRRETSFLPDRGDKDEFINVETREYRRPKMKLARQFRMQFVVFGASLSFAAAALSGNLKDVNNRANYVIIAPPSYSAMAETLAAFRREKNGFSAMVVGVDSIVAQFGAGTTPDTAMKNFMQYALNNWSDPKPQYFVLAGNTNTVPSHVEPETIPVFSYDTLLMIDQWFIELPDSNGVQQVNACIGRLPAKDSLSLAVMIQKTIAYEQDTAGTWCGRAILLSDYDTLTWGLFENDANALKSLLGSVWSDTVSVYIQTGSPYHLDSTGFLNLWNAGAAIISYTGHANQVVLSATHYFTTQDVDSLHNAACLPVCLLGGCDLTYDTGPQLSIPTHLLERNGGGAVAVVSSEGLMYENSSQSFYSSMISAMIQKPDAPVGLSFEQAKIEANAWDMAMVQRFTFLGDPALRVKHPAGATIVRGPSSHPETFALMQNYPNPFNPATVIMFQLPVASSVTLKIYDLLGREVRTLINGREGAGIHSVTFNAGGLASGVYLYRLQAGSPSDTKKLILLK